MKTITSKLSIFAFLMFTGFLMVSCGGSKEAEAVDSVDKNTGGFNEITIPCAKDGYSDKKFFRASSSGKSKDLATSREKALLMTKQRLASLISSTLKSVTERYVNEMDAADATEFNQTFENMTRDVVKQQLADIRVTCEKTGKKDDGSFETFIAIEVDKETILNGIDKGISRDKKMEVLYDKERFKKTYEAEMDKM